MKIKSFHIKAQPTVKGNGGLSGAVDSIVNQWLHEDESREIIQISHSARSDISFPEAFVVIVYNEGSKDVVNTDEQKADDGDVRRRGRPPKNQF